MDAEQIFILTEVLEETVILRRKPALKSLLNPQGYTTVKEGNLNKLCPVCGHKHKKCSCKVKQ